MTDRLETIFRAPFAQDSEDLFEIRQELGEGYVGVSREGHACLLIPLGAGRGMQRTLGNIRLLHFEGLRFKIGEKAWVQPGAVLECREPELVPTFCAFARGLIAELPTPPISPKALNAHLAKWDRLLRCRRKLEPHQIRGLWGELTLAASLPDFEAALAGWLGPARAPVDFLNAGISLECKTSLKESYHVVSGSQVKRDTSTDAYLVSLWIQEDPDGGESLSELTRRLAGRALDEDAFRVKLLQAGYSDADDKADHYSARYRLMTAPAVYPIEVVPMVAIDDARIRNVRYEVDMSTTERLSEKSAEILFDRFCERSRV